MTSARLDVKVIYDASGKHARRSSATAARAGAPSSRWLTIGVMNLLIAGGLYYGAWWRVDREVLYPNLIMHSTIPGVDLSLLEKQMFRPPTPANGKATARTPNKQASKAVKPVGKPAPVAPTKPKLRTVDAHTIQLWGAAYAWLALATIASCALAMSSGSLFGRWRGGSIRRTGVILTVGAVLGLTLAVLSAFNKYGMEFPTRELRFGMGGLSVVAFCIGVAIAGRVRGLGRIAAGTLLLSAIGSVVGLWLWSRLGAIPPGQATATFLAIAFVIHSGWAWALWPIASRLPR